ncbi:uncharacterized protein M421DRAFT_406264 [Didymella exigua CBS 183.55]|uniref:DUF7029 domain-containing protein n=1 Tax=Didymella exigua CBS 183.55 TaxID=1150837 RepID=A0A6A5RWF7_9PLEO|nr:uncharacterized protein M421DRAFT_406264 [Didymella exigua CBS 183.55]KAF1931913.1 hypothetical protein M421DRAFT_406264 [Didymella exigua CBS 183.55]
MRHLELPKILLLALYASSVGALVQDGNLILRAATRRSDLHKRDTRIIRKYESEVVYVEGTRQRSSKIFASTVKVASRRPILYLEEIEHFLRDVQCQDGRMMLHFVDAGSAQDARAACHGGHGGTGGLIITSHQSCNRDGERAVYKIDEVSFAEDGVALDLAVTEALWQDAFDNLDITFGHTLYDHIYRRHSEFSQTRGKRQDEMIVEMPSDALDNVTHITFDLTSEILDYTFTVEDFLTGLESIVNLPSTPNLPIDIGCKNCSSRGQVILTQGTIKIDTKQIDLIPDILEGGDDSKEINSVITGGYMDLAVTGLGARLEMFARPVKSGSYEVALVPLPIFGFVIPGIGQAGAYFEPKISADFEIDEELAVNYGIDVAIPDGAGIKVELGNLANTSISDIKGATLDALPFSSNVTDADIVLSLAFTPTISIGFEFSDKLNALITVSLDLRLDAKLMTGAKEQCNLLAGGMQTVPKDAGIRSLVLVETNISVVIDVAAELTLPLLPAPFDSAGTSANIFSTKTPLVTTCVDPVKGALQITEMAPVTTIKAHTEVVQAPTTSTCTKFEGNKPCECAAVTTTVYAAPPTRSHVSSSPRKTAPPLDMTPYYSSTPIRPVYDPKTTIETPTGGSECESIEQSPTSTPCTSSQTLRVTISTIPVPTTEASNPLRIVIISAPSSKPCNSSTSETPAAPYTSTTTPIITTSGAEDGYFISSSTISQTLETATSLEIKNEGTSTMRMTSPPKVEESKGFMAPSHSATGTGDVVTSTGMIEFTGAAAPGVVVPQVRREIGWQITVLAASVGFGILLI